MVLFFIVLLCISVLGLVSLVAIKRWEMNSGRVVMSSVRPTAGALFGSGLHFVERKVPGIVRNAVQRAFVLTKVLSHRLTALVVLHTERGLERTLETIKHKTGAPAQKGQASEFLREVAQHKKALQDGSAEERAIYEE